MSTAAPNHASYLLVQSCVPLLRSEIARVLVANRLLGAATALLCCPQLFAFLCPWVLGAQLLCLLLPRRMLVEANLVVCMAAPRIHQSTRPLFERWAVLIGEFRPRPISLSEGGICGPSSCPMVSCANIRLIIGFPLVVGLVRGPRFVAIVRLAFSGLGRIPRHRSFLRAGHIHWRSCGG